MNIVFLSQRVDEVTAYHEVRDALDQNWARLMMACGYTAIPVANCCGDVSGLVGTLHPLGILLTGGNDLAKYGGAAPRRDETERELIRVGLANGIPVMGVCRGMQMITDYFGGELRRVEGHVGGKHMVYGTITRQVNSFHHYTTACAPKEFEVLAQTEQGDIEAIFQREKRILGIMWHPERTNPFSEEDVFLIKSLFERKEVTK